MCSNAFRNLNPPGVAARDLRECLLISGPESGNEGWGGRKHPFASSRRPGKNVNYKQIVRSLKVDMNQVLMASRIISGFDPRPGSSFSTE